MAAIEKERATKRDSLRVLTSVPFDMSNKEHLAALTKYSNQFECITNQKYLFQALKNGGLIGMGGWLLGLILPIPEIAKYCFAYAMYFGIGGAFLDSYSETDYYNQLQEMKSLYNWCFKNNKEHYSSAIDNTEKLAQPVLQRFVKLIAPVCPVDFMLVWPRQTEKKEDNAQSGWGYVGSLGLAAFSSTVSIFASSKPGVDLNSIRELKVSVETGALNVGVVKGFEGSIKYFTTNPDFRRILASKIGGAKEEISDAAMSAAAAATAKF